MDELQETRSKVEGYGKTTDSLSHFTSEYRRFRDERDWAQFHTPRSLLISLGAEVGELMECFQWKDDQELAQLIEAGDTEDFADEMADILMYLVGLADQMKIDLAEALTHKIAKNEAKYPVEKSKGSKKKYTEL